VCRYKNGLRLAEGQTRETRPRNKTPCGVKRSPVLTQEQVEAKRRTQERRSCRALSKMSEAAQKRIRIKRKAKERQKKLIDLGKMITLGAYA